MWRVVLGTVFGIYLAQTYKIPSIRSKCIDIEKYIRENKFIEENDDDIPKTT